MLMARFPADAESLTGVLIQAYIPGPELAIDGYVENGRSQIVAIIDKPDVLPARRGQRLATVVAVQDRIPSATLAP